MSGPTGTTRLKPKAMHVLVCLVEQAGHVVAKEQLMRTVWPGTFVTDDVLTRCISELRRVFGDDPKDARVIQTIPKNGYRLIAAVSFNDSQQHIAATGRLFADALGSGASGRWVWLLSSWSRSGFGSGWVLARECRESRSLRSEPCH